MFVYNIDPVLLRFFGLEVRYYGVIFVIGFLLTYYFLMFLSKERNVRLTKDDISDLLLYLIIGVVSFARIFYILFYNLEFYLSNPFDMVAIWHGGLSFHGGLVGAIVSMIIYCKVKKVNFYELADMIVIPTALALCLGRIGNFLNGELYGRVTNVSWAVDFGDGLGRHPSQIYESFKNLFIFSVLMTIRNKKLPKGFLFWSFVTMYGVLRFLVEFVREPDPQLGFILFGLSMGQLLSSVMFVVGIVFLWRIKWSKKR